MKDSFKAHLMLLTTATIGGFNFTVSKIVMPDYAKPLAIVLARGFLTIGIYAILHVILVREKIQKQDYGRLFFAALFGITINQISFYEGLNLTSPINASFMTTVTPIMVLLIAIFLGKEKFTLLKVVGILIGATGTTLLLMDSSVGEFKGLFIGDFLILINAICWAGYLVTVKPLVQKYHPLTILKWIFFIGVIMILPFGYNDFSSTKWQLFTIDIWWAFMFIVLIATVLSYFLNTTVLKIVNPSLAGSYIYLQPLLASIIAIAWGFDHFSLEKLSYLVIILSGVYLVSFKK